MTVFREKIAEAAILDSVTREIYCGKRHAYIIRNMVEKEGIKPPVDGKRYPQGFTTNLGRFVEREEAAVIAFLAKQIPAPQKMLYSEDIIKL